MYDVGVPNLAAVEWRPWELAGRREYGHTETVSINLSRLSPSDVRGLSHDGITNLGHIGNLQVRKMITPLQMALDGATYASTTSRCMVYPWEMAVIVDLKPKPCGNTCHLPIWELLCSFPSCLVVFASTSSARFLFTPHSSPLFWTCALPTMYSPLTH